MRSEMTTAPGGAPRRGRESGDATSIGRVDSLLHGAIEYVRAMVLDPPSPADECGFSTPEFERQARRWLLPAHADPFDAVGIADGIGGVGLAALWMYRRTNDASYLDAARRIGDRLWRTARPQERGACWPSADGAVRYGFARGASGVAAFLLYLYLATGEWRWLQLGCEAIEFDLHRWCARDDGWIHGTSGMAAVLTRYFAVLGLHSHRTALCLVIDRSAGYGETTPDYFHVLAGIGQFLLDAALLCRARRAERLVMRTAAALAGSAATQFTGSAHAVALFLRRLQARQTSSVMLDELFALEHLQRLAY